MKKGLIKFVFCIMATASLFTTASISTYAGHKHTYGSSYTRTFYKGGNDINDINKCATAYVYYFKKYQTCGEENCYRLRTEIMSHNFKNGKYCGMSYGIAGYFDQK